MYVNINNKKYSLKTLQLLTGKKDVDINNIPEHLLLIAEAVDQPDQLPYLIERITSLKINDKEKFRFALIRIQIDSELHMNEDIQKNQKQLYVAQVIEKLVYGDILLETPKENEDEEEEYYNKQYQEAHDVC